MQKWLASLLFAGLINLPPDLQAERLDTAVLTNIAARYQLPKPPDGARLVLAHTESWSMLGNESTSRDPGIYSPAFLLEEQTNGNVVALRGSEQVTLRSRAREPLYRPFSTARVEFMRGGYVTTFDYLSAFVCAVQLAQRGDEVLAQQIWNEFRLADYWSDESAVMAQAGQQVKNPSLLLARCVYDHLRKQVLQQADNWPEIYSQLKDLFDEFPALKTGERKELFAGLAGALSAKPAASGSVEALLLDWSRRPRQKRHERFFDNQADAPAREIVLRGMDAVPELAALLDDQRITVHEVLVPNLTYNLPHIQNVGELAGMLLEKIAGLPSTGMGETPNIAGIRSWLEQRGNKDEELALIQSAFIRVGGKITRVNETPVRILGKKYPQRLLKLCDEFSRDATSETSPYALAEALALAEMPKEVRVNTLAEFAQRGSLLHKRCVLQNLAELDEKKCVELLLPLLDRLPKDAAGPYWTCPEADFTHVMMQIEDDVAWSKYAQVARRSSVGLRMEMLGPLDYAYIGEKNRARRLALLAVFLNDKAVRNDARQSAKYDGPCAAFTFHKISVQNFAALQIASIFELPDSPDEFWSSVEWEKLRTKVQTRLAAENLPDYSKL